MTQPSSEQLRDYVGQVATTLMAGTNIDDTALVAAVGAAAKLAADDMDRGLLTLVVLASAGEYVEAARLLVATAMNHAARPQHAAQPQDPFASLLSGGLPPLDQNNTPTTVVPAAAAPAATSAPLSAQQTGGGRTGRRAQRPTN